MLARFWVLVQIQQTVGYIYYHSEMLDLAIQIRKEIRVCLLVTVRVYLRMRVGYWCWVGFQCMSPCIQEHGYYST